MATTATAEQVEKTITEALPHSLRGEIPPH